MAAHRQSRWDLSEEENAAREVPREWLETHGRHVLELIACFDLHLPTTLRALTTMATGYPCSSPTKECRTCARDERDEANASGCCGLVRASMDRNPFPSETQAVLEWMALHRFQAGYADPPLCDCPGWVEVSP